MDQLLSVDSLEQRGPTCALGAIGVALRSLFQISCLFCHLAQSVPGMSIAGIL